MKIQVKVIPKSSCNKVEKIPARQCQALAGGDEVHYKVKVTAVPEKGKANLQVIKLLSEYFKISKSKIEIIRGQTIPDKFIEIIGL